MYYGEGIVRTVWQIDEGQMNDWEVFTRRSSPTTGHPVVTIQKRGNLALNEAAVEMLGKPNSVELLFDRQFNRIGIRPVADEVPHAYQVRQQKRSRSYLISGTAFTKFYRIPTDVSRRYAAKLQGDVMVIDLDDEMQSSGPQRAQ